MTQFALPDVLVLAAGGVLGEAWMSGVLAGIEDAADVDFRDVEDFVGTSAGSIVATHLVAGKRPRRPRRRASGADPGYARDAKRSGEGGPVHDEIPGPDVHGEGRGLPGPLRFAARMAAFATMPLAPAAIAIGAPVGARARALFLSRLPDRGIELRDLHREMDRLGARFDGRLRVCTVDRATGRRVVFGRPGSPKASVADAVAASCAIPWVFRPVEIGGREYVDGGAWSLTNLDTAPAGRESEVVCLHPSLNLGLALSSLFGLARTTLAAAAELEAMALRARGARVRMIGPSADAAERMGLNFMDPRPSSAVHAAGYRQGLALGA